MHLRFPMLVGVAGVGLLLAGGVAVFLSCSGITDECHDFEDNDKDGLVDSADPACQWADQEYRYGSPNCTQAQSGLPVRDPACDWSTSQTVERADPDCADHRDNDGDGLVDGEDPGCQSSAGEPVLLDDDETNPECSDGKDNDDDGRVDMQDPACLSSGGVWQRNGASEKLDPACADLKDNDGDGRADFPLDLGCVSAFDRSEINPQCSDGQDNDGDGQKDFPGDPDCSTALQDREAAFACGDQLDNDLDGLIDFPADLGCASRFDDSEANPACSDSRDNDGDGQVDFPADPGCSSLLDSAETKASCSDGLDNDQDGRTDFPADLGCHSPEDNGEGAECDDGMDNDGDGAIDFGQDPGCASPHDTQESDGTDYCGDGLDNDGDGLIDFPQDPGCSALSDNEEADDWGDCADRLDNDGDLLIDKSSSTNLGDPACNAGYIWEHLDPVCGDRADNDGDGRADYLGVDLNYDGRFDGPGEFPPDPGCDSVADYAEAPKPQCADRIDNDGDGTVDWGGIDLDNDGLFTGAGEMAPDYACTANQNDPMAGQRRRDESRPEQCRDGVDNDGDGLFDFQPEFIESSPGVFTPNPNLAYHDPHCASAIDNREDQ